MSSELSECEKWIVSELAAVPEVAAAVGARVFNSVAGRDAIYPVLIFQLIPLQDSLGQAQTPFQTRFLIDLKVISRGAPADASEAAVSAIKEHFKSRSRQLTDNFILSMRHDRPVNFTSNGTGNDDNIYFTRGGTFKIWMSARA